MGDTHTVRKRAMVEDHEIVQRNIALQKQWYGEPLGDRVRRLVVAFNISQAYLAEVLGISAPMLSQVMSARRAKIGNPVTLAKMIMLERKCLIPEVAAGRRDALAAALEDVRLANPTVGRDNFPVDAVADDQAALGALREIAEFENLAEAAERLGDDFPSLSDLLRRAATEH